MEDKIISFLSSFTRKEAQHHALLVSPSGDGSLGDEAMLSASAQHLSKNGFSKIDVLHGKDRPLDAKFNWQMAGERYFYQNSRLVKIILESRIPKYSNVYMVGADVLDGNYNPKSVIRRLSLLEKAVEKGNKATLLGGSYNKNPEESTKNALRNLPEEIVICARDPSSKARMEQHLNRPIRQVADLAFLLEENPIDPISIDAANWIDGQKQQGRQVVALNANSIHDKKNPGLSKALSHLIAGLVKKDISVVLIPHDVRGERPDELILKEAASNVDKSFYKHIYPLPPKSPSVVKATLRKVDFTITGRMHAAILGMSAGTPAYCFAYQDKFDGLFSFFELEKSGLLSTPEEFSANPDKTLNSFLEHMNNKNEIEKKIKEHLPRVFELSRNNFL